MKLDMHLHSNHSSDAVSKPETIMKIAKKKELVIAITDHNTTSAWSVFKKISKEMNWPIIFGEEIKTLENGKCIGEIVGLFLTEEIKPASPQEVLDKIHSQGAIAMVVHPFDTFRNPFKYLKENAKKIDLLEVFNARTIRDAHNKQAKEFAQKNNLPMTANSDSHSPKEIGVSYTEVNASTLEKARKELLHAKTTLCEKKSPHTVHIVTTLAKLNLLKDE